MSRRKPSPAELAILFAFHAALSGAFLVAYVTGDEDTYGMHVVAGYTVLGALLVRLTAGVFAPTGSPLCLPGPRVAEAGRYMRRLLSGDSAVRQERSPLYAWMAAILLIATSVAAVSGAVADFVPKLDDLHEALGEIALYLALGHIAIVAARHAVKPRRSVLSAASSRAPVIR